MYFIDMYIMYIQREKDTKTKKEWKAESHSAQTDIELTM